MTITSSTRRSLAVAGLALATLALAACGSSTTSTESTATTAPARAEVTVTDPWVRQSPAATTAGAAYMTLTSTVDDQLVSASVPTSVAAKTELHETVATTDTTAAMGTATTTTAMGNANGNGMGTGTTMMGGSAAMTMRPVASIALPAGEAVSLKPGGYHIMMLDLVKPLVAGEQITITLTFEKAGTQEVTATVRES